MSGDPDPTGAWFFFFRQRSQAGYEGNSTTYGIGTEDLSPRVNPTIFLCVRSRTRIQRGLSPFALCGLLSNRGKFIFCLLLYVQQRCN
jgi:hypothetical protein